MDDIIGWLQGELNALADPETAAGMGNYMYGKRFQSMYPDAPRAPFYGIKKPARVPVFRELRKRLGIANRADYEQAVSALWALPHREEKYLAVGLAVAEKRFHTLESVPLFRRLITEGAWWDIVDDVAVRCVGSVLFNERPAMTPVIEAWIDDEDLWIRRSALLSHLKHREDTDEEMLFDHCLRRAHEKEFFIRKAIGWALREHAKTSPDAVWIFADRQRGVLSGLSYREATKHL